MTFLASLGDGRYHPSLLSIFFLESINYGMVEIAIFPGYFIVAGQFRYCVVQNTLV